MASKVDVIEIELERHPQPRSPMSSASLKDLPFDILYIITIQLLQDESRPEVSLCLSQICRSLRAFAVRTPILWSSISFSNPRPISLSFEEQRLWLQRSGAAPLSIHINPSRSANHSFGFSMKALARVMALLVPHIGRWESFKLDYSELSPKGYHLVLDQLWGKTAPELETFGWIVPRGIKQRRHLKPSNVDLPKLRYLELRGRLEQDDVLQIRNQWPTLRRVKLRKIPDWRRPDQLEMARVQQLFALPFLEELIIVGWRMQPSGELLSPVVSAPSLRSMHLDDWWPGGPALSAIAVRLHAPELTNTHPTVVLEDQTISAVARLPSFPWPRLTRVAVNLAHTSDILQLVRVMRSLQELKELDVDGYFGQFQVADALSSTFPFLHYLTIAGSSIHLTPSVRQIAQSRLENQHLSSLTYLELRLGSLEGYMWQDYIWLRGYVPDFVSNLVPPPPDQLLMPPTKKPRRRYRKARTKPRWPGAKLSPRNLTRQSQVSQG